MPTATLNDGMAVHCLVRSEALVLDHHVRGYFNHGIDVRDGDIVFDVGANIGVFALRALERGPSVRVFAFEPIPDIYAVLARNCARHGEGRMAALPYGVSSKPGRACFDYYPNSPALSTAHPDLWDTDPDLLARAVRGSARNAPPELWQARFVSGFLSRVIARRLRRGARHVDCELRTLSQIIRDRRVPRVDLLKIDCEGAELDALMGIDEEHWPLIGKVIVEVHDLDGRVTQVKRLLREHGFRHVVVDREPGFEDTPLYNLHATRNG